MSDSVKGGLFVGAAVAVGLIVGFVVPALVEDRRRGSDDVAQRTAAPVMPNVVGRTLDDAERQLRRREIAYVTDDGDVFGVVVPSVWEVCETSPRAGASVRRSARVRAALPGTCALG